MASRLSRTTRQLFLAVERARLRLQLSSLGTPPLAALISLVVTGLILLDARPTHTRRARFLPARAHDAFNRLLCAMPFSTRALMALLLAFATRLGRDGYLVLDDVSVEKARAKQLRWAARIYSFAKQRSVWGFQVLVLLWCSQDGQWRLPRGFRRWRPKRSCRKVRYQTKLHLAEQLVRAVVRSGLPIAYSVGDTHYPAGWFTNRLAGLGLTWQGTLDPKTHVVWHGKQQSGRDLAPPLKLKWRGHLQVRATALSVYAPKYGHIRLVVVKNRHGNWE